MSEGLKALERVKKHSRVSVEYFYEHYGEDLDIVEEELKEYQHHEEILNWYDLTLANFREACLLLAMLKGSGRTIHDIDKQLQVLEVIKRISYYDIHFLDYLLNEGKISREEYNSLKEVLLQKQ